MAVWGLYAEAPLVAPAQKFYLWPENVPYWDLFMACHTQWHHGMEGRVSLNYPGVEVVMERRRIPLRKRNRAFELLQAMETGALQGWHEARERARAKG